MFLSEVTYGYECICLKVKQIVFPVLHLTRKLSLYPYCTFYTCETRSCSKRIPARGDPQRDPSGSRALCRTGAESGVGSDPEALGLGGAFESRHRNEPSAIVQRHSGEDWSHMFTNLSKHAVILSSEQLVDFLTFRSIYGPIIITQLCISSTFAVFGTCPHTCVSTSLCERIDCWCHIHTSICLIINEM